MKTTTKLRWIYGGIALLILLAEVVIALWVHDQWIRPYGGDVLVTLLLCCMLRTILPNKPKLLPLYIWGFSALVEVAQWMQLPAYLGLDRIPAVAVMVGSTFSIADLLCYAVGCLLFLGAEFCLRPSLYRS